MWTAGKAETYTIHEGPQYAENVGIWRAMFDHKIIGPVFFQGIVDTDEYLFIYHSLWNSWTVYDSLEVTSSWIVLHATSQDNPLQLSRVSLRRAISRDL
jgi:hypothetical protein